MQLSVGGLHSTACDAHTSWCWVLLHSTACDASHLSVVLLHSTACDAHTHVVEWRRTTLKCEHHMQLSGGGLHSSVSSSLDVVAQWSDDYIKCEYPPPQDCSVMHHSWVEDYIKCEHHTVECSPPPLNCMWCITCSWLNWSDATSSVSLHIHVAHTWGGLHQVWCITQLSVVLLHSSVSITCSWVEVDYIKCEHHTVECSPPPLKCEHHTAVEWTQDYIKCWASHAVEWRTTSSVMHHAVDVVEDYTQLHVMLTLDVVEDYTQVHVITHSWCSPPTLKCEHHMQLSGASTTLQVWCITCSWVEEDSTQLHVHAHTWV